MIRDTLRWVIVAAVSLVATTACVADKGSAAPGLADSTTGPSASVSSGLPVQSAEGITRFDDPGLAGFLLADPAHHRLWSGTSSGLWWIDPETEVAHVVDDIPGVYLAVYHDSLFRAAWAHDNVARYDLRDDVREDVRRDAPSPLNIAAGPAGVWVSDHNHGNLLRLDPQTMRVTAKVKIGDGKGLGPAGLQWQGEDLWVNVKRDSTLALVDGGNGHVLRRIPLDGVDIGDELAMTIAGLWAMVFRSDSSTMWELIDTQTSQVKARLEMGDRFSATPIEVDGQIWLPIEDKLLHLDQTHGWQPDRVLDLRIPGFHPRFDAVGFGSAWISSLDPALMVRVPFTDLR